MEFVAVERANGFHFILVNGARDGINLLISVLSDRIEEGDVEISLGRRGTSAELASRVPFFHIKLFEHRPPRTIELFKRAVSAAEPGKCHDSTPFVCPAAIKEPSGRHR